MPAQIRFNNPIITQPADINATADETIAFSVTVADPNDVINYQWQVSTDEGDTYTNISGETGSTYILVATNSLHNNRYRVVIFYKQTTQEKIHNNYAYNEVDRIYSNGAILSIIGYVTPSSINFEFIIP